MTTPDYSFPNITPWTNSQVRNGPFPLDRYSVFSSLADAKEYAAGVLAYSGQVITVTKDGKPQVFTLDPTLSTGDGYLRKLPDAKDLSDAVKAKNLSSDIKNALTGTFVTKAELTGYTTNGVNGRYKVQTDTSGFAYVYVPQSGGGGGGGTNIEVDNTTIKKNASDGDKLYVDVTELSSGLSNTFQAKGTYLSAVPSTYKTYAATLSSLSSDYLLKSCLSGYVDNNTLSTNNSGKLFVKQILSNQVFGLGSFATKSSLLSTDIPTLDSTKISDFDDFARKATTLSDYGILDAKIESGVSITLGKTTISVLTAHQQVSDISADMAAALRASLSGSGYALSTFETYPMQLDNTGKAFVSVDVSYRPRDCEVSLTGSTVVEITTCNRSLHYVELANTSPQQNLVIYPETDELDKPFDAVLLLKPTFPLTSVRIGHKAGGQPSFISPDPEAATRTVPNNVTTCISLTRLPLANTYMLNRSLMYEFSQS